MRTYGEMGFILAVAVIGLLTAPAARGQQFNRQAYEQAIGKMIEKMARGVKQGPFKPDWKSLEKHIEAPEWFRDAKFGIYFHWCVYSVPAYGNEWYPKWMHTKQGRRSYYKHHVETYGEPDKFGYHDFVPRFKAERFDADEWAELFRKAGAQYAGPVCEHHDGYSMWASDLTPWNAGATGPKRDITGELAKAIRKRGMKLVTTFHHERTRTWYPRVEGWPTTSDDPRLQLLYMNIPEELFNRIFQAKLGEVIDKYQPDLIWFDGQMTQIKEPYHLQFLAYYFNSAKTWGRDVVVTTKKKQYPPEVSVEDFEKGRMDRLTDFCWLTDDTISTGSWCYTQNLQIKPAIEVVHVLIDIVSKNGCLLLNISPKSDGTIPDNQRQVLLEMGDWLKVNGEAI
ncbi:MAG: alpha-L-fucosidase, partial [Phycisphaerae bacterium]